jgi:type IV pilus assembly protein PilW
MKTCKHPPRGVSLIELMVALTIGSLLIIGAVTVYTQSRTTYRVNETVARMQENARYALSMIEPDIRLANHWGLMSDPLLIVGAVGNSPMAVPASAQSCGANFPIDLRLPVDGEDGVYALPCAVDATTGVAAQAGADTLILRRASTDAVAADADRIQVYTTRQGGASRIFQAGAAPGPMVNDPLYGPSAEVRNLVVRAYYIARQSSLGPNVPALRRKTLEGGPGLGPHFDDEEIMPGIEDMQVQFGLDTGADLNGDGVPDDSDGNGQPDFFTGVATRYVNPGDPLVDGNPANGEAVVCAVRIWLRVRSETPEVGYVDAGPYVYAGVNFVPNDNFRRMIVSRTIQIRNTQT